MKYQELTSGLVSIHDLLSGDNRYVVPRYQREYSWAEDDIKKFIEDVKSLVDDNRPRKKPYFFGTMVFVHMSDENSSEDVFKIVDGQQRLITSIIFLTALCDVLYAAGHTHPADEFRRYIQETDLESGKVSYRIIPTFRNQDFFRDHIMNIGKPKEKCNIEDINVNTANKELFNAYKIICESLYTHDGVSNLVALGDRFAKNFKVILVTVTSDTDAYRIFETLNSRGLELSQGDLVKSHLLGCCEADISLQDDVFETWMNIIHDLDKTPMDDFLRHFWLANYEKIKKDEIYEKITNKASDSITAKNLTTEMYKYAEIYSRIVNPKLNDWSNNEQIVNNLEILKILNSTVCYIALLIGANKLATDDFNKLIKLCINFFFRYKTVCGKHATQLENLMISIAADLRDGKELKDIKKYFTDPKIYPNDDEFEYVFARVNLTDKIAIYALRELDGLKHTPKLYLEHIMPKSIVGTEWEKHLKDLEIRDLDSYGGQWYSRLGNMILTKKRLNPEERKNPYNKKHEKFYKDSPEITNMPLDLKWDHVEIEKRQKRFANIAKNIWKID